MDAARMKWIRKALGLGQQAMADRLGLRRNEQVSRLENGATPAGATLVIYRMLEQDAIRADARRKRKEAAIGATTTTT